MNNKEMLKAINKAIEYKEKNKWSKGNGSAFTQEEIINIRVGRGFLYITLKDYPTNRTYRLNLYGKNGGLNLNETKTIRDYLKTKLKVI